MHSPRILIFGGHSDHLYQVTQVLPGSCMVSIFPLLHQVEERDFHPRPHLVIIIQEETNEKALNCLERIGGKLSGIPVLFLAENPSRQAIIQAFRHGVADYLLFPLQPDVFLQVMKGYLKKRNRSLFGLSFRNWGSTLRRMLGLLPEGKKRSPDFTSKSSLGFPLGRNPFRSAKEKKNYHEVDVQFFGSFVIIVRGQVLRKLPGEKVNALLAYLLYHHQKPEHREILLSKFWGYTQPSAARNSLNVAMHTIRRHFQEVLPEEELIHYYDDNYSINPALDIFTDVHEFLRHWRSGRFRELRDGLEQALPHYQKAASLYRGDFLEGIYYEEWCEMERDNLKETYLHILDRLAAYFFEKEAYPLSIQLFQKMLDKDDCLEDVHRKLILCYYRLGYRDKAIKQYYKCAEILERELKIEPSQSTRELLRLIRAEKNIPMVLF